MSRKDFVIYEHDPEAPLTLAQKAELEALEVKPDSEINLTDITPLDEAFWRSATRNPIELRLSVRLDADILNWLKSSGKGYESKLNAILRRAMLDEGRKRRGGAQE